jgi:hypothetical protein
MFFDLDMVKPKADFITIFTTGRKAPGIGYAQFCRIFCAACVVFTWGSAERRRAAPLGEAMHLNLPKKGLQAASHKNLIQCFKPGIHPRGQNLWPDLCPWLQLGRLVVFITGRFVVFIAGRLVVFIARRLHVFM